MFKHLFIYIFTMVLFMPQISMSFQNEPDGFRGIKWGTDISALSDMKEVKSQNPDKSIKMYARKDDDMAIGAAKIESIDYVFQDGKFYAVFVRTFFYSDYEALKEACFERFGRGTRAKAYAEEYTWSGEKTSVSLMHNQALVGGVLTIMSTEAYRRIEEQKKQRDGNLKGF